MIFNQLVFLNGINVWQVGQQIYFAPILAFFVLGLILCWAFGKLETLPGASRRMSIMSTLPIVVVGVEASIKHKAIQVDFTGYLLWDRRIFCLQWNQNVTTDCHSIYLLSTYVSIKVF